MARRMTAAEKSSYRRTFPSLPVDSLWVWGEATTGYNCLAWALGRTNGWVWPWGRNATVNEMTAFLRTQGYSLAVGGALSVYGPNLIGHASRYTNGTWSSKCGSGLLLTHSLNSFVGSLYGPVRLQYTRRGVTDSLGEPTIEAETPMTVEFSTDEQSLLHEKVSAVPDALTKAFSTAYDAWLASWTIEPYPPTQNAEFSALLALGPEIVPLLVGKLEDAESWPAVVPLEHFLPAESLVRFELDDPAVLEGEQARARLTALGWLRSQM